MGFISFLSVLFMALGASTVFAEEVKNCNTDFYVNRIDQNSTLLHSALALGGESWTAQDWQECYGYAHELALKNPFFLGDSYGDSRVVLSVHWTFNDSFVPYMDSSGVVTKFTPVFMEPMQGDRSYDESYEEPKSFKFPK